MRVFLIFILWAAGLLPPAQAEDLVPGYWEQTPLPHTGLATFYAAGMMEHVLAVRGGHGQVLRCDECVGTVALLRAGDIGRKVWLQPLGGERVGPFLVIDCARREDIPPLVARNWAVDVSYELGALWGMDRPLDGVMVLADPADEGHSGLASGPLQAPTPFFVPPDKLVVSAPTPTPAVSPTPAQLLSWPTRLPVALNGGMPSISTPSPVESATPSASPRPTPLTPEITTPTPRVTPRPAVATSTTATETPAAPQAPVAVGRPGLGVLTPDQLPVLTARPSRAPATATPSVSVLRQIGTPFATSLPILRSAALTPPGGPAGNESGDLLAWLRALLDRLRP